MKDRNTYPSRDLSFSISLRSPRLPYSASHHFPRHHSTDRPSGRSDIRHLSASNTRQSDSRGTVQERYARNRRIRANAPYLPPRGGHDAIRGNGRARRLLPLLAQRAPSEGPRWTRAVREQTSLPSEEVDKTRILDTGKVAPCFRASPKGKKHRLNEETPKVT